MQSQRYVSRELTHFVGRACRRSDGEFDEDAQYDLLVQILRDGCLLHRLDAPDGPSRVSFLGNGSFLERTMIAVDAVCFCDIPAADFAIHMEKYGRFGLGFLKSFMVTRGANPAFYIASDSTISPDEPTAVLLGHESPVSTLGTLMERLIREQMVGDYRQLDLALSEGKETIDAATRAVLAKASLFGSMIRGHFLSYCVPFDSTSTEAAEKNYYMEREWRVTGRVCFNLDDVCRVILPSGYAKRFRSDLPAYAGQITFAD
jgi:hypothetical protein